MSNLPMVDVFDRFRPLLTRVAYRMLGSVADAEDVVQDAYLRWHQADRHAVVEPAAFLRRVVTRLCLDRLKAVRRGRHAYVGQWLPEPLVQAIEDEADDVTLPLLLVLERLSPLERAAFLLHDVFGLSFEEVATTIARDPAACRQLASRARTHVRAARPRFPLTAEQGLEIVEAFYLASRQGDMERLRAMLAEGVTLWADGGGKAPARKDPAVGVDAVLRAYRSYAAVYAAHGSHLVRYCRVNGLPGLVSIEHGEILQTTALDISSDGIAAIYVTRNPDKLRHMGKALP